ncbi:aldehyde dehydrogenase family protein [Burkholderia multivorans]|nr:aldehyde dehydrogenase family protein [Burkholderia multivorans]MBY4795323.1 aldehyde dehydrogenase family protein [Burkholderia multivorans]PRE71390.1 hypothetical protein C6P86_05515 [Burkholderia multivorans]PRG25058.1 hypothetical protein C6T57_08600 [Burkholderia multivorans]
MAEIVVAGELLAEFVATERGRSFDTPGLFAGPFPSGAPAIFADQAARLGARVAYAGCVGRDAFGDAIVARLAHDGVDVARIRRVARPTGTAFVAYRDDGSRSFVYTLSTSAAACLDASDVDTSMFDGCRYFHVMGSSLTGESAIAAVRRGVIEAARVGAKVSFDPNVRPEMLSFRPMRAALDEMLAACHLFLPSEADLPFFCGPQSPERAIAALLATHPLLERVVLKRGAAGSVAFERAQFVAAMAAETGASALWAEFNVQLAVSGLVEAASLTTQVGGELIPSDVPGSLAMGVRQPAGVVLGIAPWNAPVILGTRALALPLACGNTVVLKGSELCPATHGLIVDALQEAGLPPGVVNFVTNAPDDAGAVVAALIAHPAVRRVNFTGSTRVGRIIAEACARHLKPAVLELGGKAPFVVLDDADLDAAVDAAAFGAFANSGQICMSTERIVVDTSIADAFVAKLADKAASLPLGDPRNGPVVLGSLIDAKAVERCNALIDDALAHGATLLCGGKADSTLFPATLLDHVTPAMRDYAEESFGPVKGIVRVDGEEAAIRCANDNAFGLSSAVFSRDVARALRVAARIESGICHVNGPTVHDEAQMPFGGVKDSGFGHFGGKAGIAAFTDLRWITVQTAPRHYPF